MPFPGWRSRLYDGATGIGPLLRLAGGDDPKEWDSPVGPTGFHDWAYENHGTGTLAFNKPEAYDAQMKAVKAWYARDKIHGLAMLFETGRLIPDNRTLVDRHWFMLNVWTAETCCAPDRAAKLIKIAKLRYAVVRAVGWLWWRT